MTSASVADSPAPQEAPIHTKYRGPSVRIAGALSWLLLVILVLIVVTGGAAFFLFYQALEKLQAQERELASNSAVASTALDDLASTVQPLLQLTSGNCSSVQQIMHGLEGLSSQQREAIPTASELLNVLQLACSSGGAEYQPVQAFWASYEPAVVARQKGQYEDAVGLYRSASLVPNTQQDLKARALEGLAYSQLKLRQPALARNTIVQAQSLPVDYVYSDITALKIACEAHTTAPVVRQQFLAAVQRRDEAIANSTQSQFLERIARQDRDLLLNDPEMRFMCRYVPI